LLKEDFMQSRCIPPLLTPGRMAKELGASLSRVSYVLATRPHIQPKARAGVLRLYDRDAIAQVRHELHAIDARRTRQEGGGDER
jgi:hypothetical protein